MVTRYVGQLRIEVDCYLAELRVVEHDGEVEALTEYSLPASGMVRKLYAMAMSSQPKEGVKNENMIIQSIIGALRLHSRPAWPSEGAVVSPALAARSCMEKQARGSTGHGDAFCGPAVRLERTCKEARRSSSSNVAKGGLSAARLRCLP